MYRDSARFLIRVNIIEHQGLNVAVKNNSHQFASAIYDRASGIAADNVGGVDKIERRGEIEFRFPLFPNCGQLEGILVLVSFGVFVRAAYRRSPGNLFALFRVSLGLTKRQAQREGSVRINA